MLSPSFGTVPNVSRIVRTRTFGACASCRMGRARHHTIEREMRARIAVDANAHGVADWHREDRITSRVFHRVGELPTPRVLHPMFLSMSGPLSTRLPTLRSPIRPPPCAHPRAHRRRPGHVARNTHVPAQARPGAISGAGVALGERRTEATSGITVTVRSPTRGRSREPVTSTSHSGTRKARIAAACGTARISQRANVFTAS